MANIPTTQKPQAIEKLKKLHQQLRNICKNKDRRSNKQAELETEFGSRLLELFDVVPAECDQMIHIAHDVEFLQDQRSNTKMFMAGEDKPFKMKEKKRQKRKYNEMKRREYASKAFDET